MEIKIKFKPAWSCIYKGEKIMPKGIGYGKKAVKKYGKKKVAVMKKKKYSKKK